MGGPASGGGGGLASGGGGGPESVPASKGGGGTSASVGRVSVVPLASTEGPESTRPGSGGPASIPCSASGGAKPKVRTEQPGAMRQTTNSRDAARTWAKHSRRGLATARAGHEHYRLAGTLTDSVLA